MFEFFLEQLKIIPDYLVVLYEKHLIFVIVMLVLYLIALIFWNKFAGFLRWIYIFAAFGFLAYAIIKQHWQLLIIIIASMLFMTIVRLITHTVRASKQRKRDRKIEQRALEQAAKRRGSWEKKQAYSGSPRPVSRDTDTPVSAPAPQSSPVTQNTLTSMVDAVPKDSKAEIEATRAELKAATAQFDTEAIEKALTESQKK